MHPHLLIIWYAPRWERFLIHNSIASTAKVYLEPVVLITDTSRPSCCCYTHSRDLGMNGSKTTSCEQMLPCICARHICSSHAQWWICESLSNPCSWFSRLNRCYQRFFSWVMWSHLGHNGVHKNSSQPLIPSADGSAPSANPASAAPTVRLEALVEEMLWSWYPVVAPNEELRAEHQYHGSIGRLWVLFLQLPQYVESCECLRMCSYL